MTNGKTSPLLSQDVAVKWQGRGGENFSVSFTTMWEWIFRFSSVLKTYALQKDEMFCIFLPQLPEIIAAACGARAVGAIPIFCRDRQEAQKHLLITRAKIVLTTDELLPALDGVCLKKAIVLKRGDARYHLDRERDVWFHEVMAKATPSPVDVPFEKKAGYHNSLYSEIYSAFLEGKPQTMVEEWIQ